MPMAARCSAHDPNTLISHMLNCCCDVDLDTTSLMVRTFETGRPLAWRNCSWTALLTDRGSTCVRTTHEMGVRLTLSALAASGTCAWGMYIIGPGSLFSPP